jgi:hypothetical protein
MNISIYTCNGADDGLLSCETNRNGTYTIKATIAGTIKKITFYGAKARALASFRAMARDMCKQ